MRKTGIPEWGFRSRERAKDLKRGRSAAAVAPISHQGLLVRKTGIPERGFRSRDRAKDLKRGRYAAAVAPISHQASA